MEIDAKILLPVFPVPYGNGPTHQTYSTCNEWALPIMSSDLGSVNVTQRELTGKQRIKRYLLLRKWFPELHWPWNWVLLLAFWASYTSLLSYMSPQYISINWNKPELTSITCNMKVPSTLLALPIDQALLTVTDPGPKKAMASPPSMTGRAIGGQVRLLIKSCL